MGLGRESGTTEILSDETKICYNPGEICMSTFIVLHEFCKNWEKVKEQSNCSEIDQLIT